MLDLAPDGAIRGLRARNEELSTGLGPGGVLAEGGAGPPLPVRGTVRAEDGGWAWQPTSPRYGWGIRYRAVGEELQLRLRRNPAKGNAGVSPTADQWSPLLVLPVRLAGWRWSSNGQAGLLEAGNGTFLSGDPAGSVELLFQTPRLELRFSASAPVRVEWDPVHSALLVRPPRTWTPSEAEVLLRLTARRGEFRPVGGVNAP
jgi:hypothetical protein